MCICIITQKKHVTEEVLFSLLSDWWFDSQVWNFPTQQHSGVAKRPQDLTSTQSPPKGPTPQYCRMGGYYSNMNFGGTKFSLQQPRNPRVPDFTFFRMFVHDDVIMTREERHLLTAP